MFLLVYGLNHLTAPVALRERIAFTKESLPHTLVQAKSALGAKEIVIVSTCNRTELYCCFSTEIAQEKRRQLFSQWLSNFHQLEDENLADACYCHAGEMAVRHITRVACGLDSMVLGEPQIMGQVKQAWQISQQAKHTGATLNQLGQHVIAAAKHIRETTKIGHNPVSLAYIILKLAYRIFDSLSPCTAILIGAGEIIGLTARHLADASLGQMIMANRTLDNIQSLAHQFHAQAIHLEALPKQLASADIVISATGSSRPLISKAMVAEAMQQRKNRPVLMVDLAVPRDIEAKTKELPSVYLYSLDDLQNLILENSQKRTVAAQKAERIVVEASLRFIDYLKGRGAVDVIRALREQAQTQAQQALAEAQARLNKGEDATEVLARLAHSLTNQWLHAPTTVLRQAMTEEDGGLNDAALRLHGLGLSQNLHCNLEKK